uniref:Cytochrome c domain-containing protein n=1 Tax=Favella ehrenbergii TaxID=182087 RepID=A0A7S3HYZ4_9SPIT|mmetsp:Transcript_5698/g.7655  ORF Transcript_5698/g.7655 Transcript_5698/m.7655 type:complete len:109 (+) Transcript_5698:41-367(+)|eukprot:CAMPEP_0170463780 /NCGR_PEP_ID=MMETSP0123-20130129/8763_1 /TAXON_ID=182087 /ORGANISM="Favella ehrenbergii, Strain Fehren 1" /LENGTH=108 /DNA_ID=CAMNT_0010729297 /DNA_START=12 /DNA_END=338 /DNA_ORIENTATION=-
MPPKKKKASGNAAAGERVFKNLCGACHSLSSHSVGPALGGLPGQNIASSEGFAYSGALSSKATIKWTDGNLDKWLKSPSGFAPGNAMAFAGIANPKDRADVIAYLKGG